MGNQGLDHSNPFYTEFRDVHDKAIRITAPWDPTTRQMQGATVVREQDCLFRTILFGIGPDGSPDTSPNAFAVPFGTTNVTGAQIRANGLQTIDDVAAVQITAGR